jgi:hypothetical protein
MTMVTPPKSLYTLVVYVGDLSVTFDTLDTVVGQIPRLIMRILSQSSSTKKAGALYVMCSTGIMLDDQQALS